MAAAWCWLRALCAMKWRADAARSPRLGSLHVPRVVHAQTVRHCTNQRLHTTQGPEVARFLGWVASLRRSGSARRLLLEAATGLPETAATGRLLGKPESWCAPTRRICWSNGLPSPLSVPTKPVLGPSCGRLFALPLGPAASANPATAPCRRESITDNLCLRA